jgi:hypothetical protein
MYSQVLNAGTFKDALPASLGSIRCPVLPSPGNTNTELASRFLALSISIASKVRVTVCESPVLVRGIFQVPLLKVQFIPAHRKDIFWAKISRERSQIDYIFWEK